MNPGKQVLIKLVFISCGWMISGMTLAGCLSDLGPYEDNYGYARFPFSNSCADSATVSLCVKSWPTGSDDPVYNLYSDTIYGGDRKDLTDGLWSIFDSYEWTEGGVQLCPFE
jgi:hypothetical protein